MDSICKFIPMNQCSETIQTISFVYETNPKRNASLAMSTVYKMHYVTEGSAKVRCGNATEEVAKGDVFFAFPAVDFAIFGETDFRYMYISFVGVRARAEMEKLGIHPQNFVFRNVDGLQKIWEYGLSLKKELITLVSEGILLYTLAKVGHEYLSVEEVEEQTSSCVNASLVKSHIDKHFKEPELSSESISLYFSYNKKYICTLFRKQFKVGIQEYIKTLRIQYACSLIEKEYSNVTEIARMSGFEDALYFSKVFKKETGVSPKRYIKERQ